MQVNKESIISLSTNILNFRDFTLQKKKSINFKTYNRIVPHEAKGNKRPRNMNRALVICESASNGLTQM